MDNDPVTLADETQPWIFSGSGAPDETGGVDAPVQQADHPANCCCVTCDAEKHVSEHPRACICIECVARASGWTLPAKVAQAAPDPNVHPVNCVCRDCVAAANGTMHLRP